MAFKDLFYRETKTTVEWELHSQKYKFNTNIILSGVLFMLILAVGIVLRYEGLNGFDASKKLYLHCDDPRGCENPLYQNFEYCGKTISYTDPICNKKLMYGGETYGIAPPPIYKFFGAILFSVLLLVFLINHFVYNRSFSFKKLNEEMSKDGTK